MSGVELIDRIRQDIQYALRGLRRSPGFTAAVVLTLGLGLGVNAAMYSFLDRVFVKPPAAVANPDQVRRIYANVLFRDEPERIASTNFKYPHVREVVRLAGDSTAVGIFSPGRDTASANIGPRVVLTRRMLANTGYFTVLGVRPLLGRYFDAMEDRIETPQPVAVISHAYWKRAFDSDPAAVGSVIRIRDRAITVIGVAQEGFSGIDLDRADLWMPINNYNTEPATTPAWYDTHRNIFTMVARFETAAAERRFLGIGSRAMQQVRIPRYGFDTTAYLRTGPIVAAAGPATRGQEISISLRLAGVTLMVLLIAIANVTNLLLVRGTQRRREIAVRRALGVTHRRLLGQLLTESMVLAFLSGIVSILLAIWAGAALRALLLPQVNWPTGVLDLRTTAFAAGATMLVGLIVGTIPALQVWKPNVVASLKAGGSAGRQARSGLRTGLLIGQAALSVVLLVGAGLFVRSLNNVRSVDLGYDIEQTATATMTSTKAGLSAAFTAATPAILASLSRIAGVEAVAASSHAPMGGIMGTPIRVPGLDSLPLIAGQGAAGYFNVTPDFFKATGLRLIAGRIFTETDPGGIVITETMAKAYWPTESALTKCIVQVRVSDICLPVIGVVEDIHAYGIVEKERPAHYFQNHSELRDLIVIRIDPDRLATAAPLIKAEIKRLLPMAENVIVAARSAALERELRPWRMGATLFTALGVLALVIAAIGVYSVIAYAVSQRANEMGIRIALGAQLGDITRLVMGEGLRTVAIGIGVGIALALVAGKLVASLLYGISPRDPVVIAAAALMLAVIGLAASVIPAIRAARVNPVTTLRCD